METGRVAVLPSAAAAEGVRFVPALVRIGRRAHATAHGAVGDGVVLDALVPPGHLGAAVHCAVTVSGAEVRVISARGGLLDRAAALPRTLSRKLPHK